MCPFTHLPNPSYTDKDSKYLRFTLIGRETNLVWFRVSFWDCTLLEIAARKSGEVENMNHGAEVYNESESSRAFTKMGRQSEVSGHFLVGKR